MPAPSFPSLPTLPARRHRPGAALALAAAVLCLHGGLIGALAPRLPQPPGAAPPGPGRADVVQARLMAPGPAEGLAHPPVPTVTPQVAVAVATRPATPAAAARLPPPAPAPVAIGNPAPAGAWAVSLDGPAESADRSGAAASEAPPVYATRIPPPVRLRYVLRYNGRAGEATLVWQHDGLRYQLALEGLGAGEALVVQASQGGFDSAGLAPERFTDRRRGSRLQAANFRRDIGRIAFSGPAVDYPAWPGAQDRLSWLPQFVAIRAAAAWAAPTGEAGRSAISLFVVDARGAAALWRFQAEGEVELATPLGRLATQHWRREPPRPEGLRVEAWLDASRGHWPVQLRFTALRSGDVFELLLQHEPGVPP